MPGHAPMLLWASLLVLAPAVGQLAATPKPVISLHPPWTTVFRGQAVTLTCNASRVPAAENMKWYRWFLGATMLRETPGNTLEARVSGMYKCQTQDLLLSDSVTLIFSSGVFRTTVDVRVSSSNGSQQTSLCIHTAEQGAHFRGFETEATLAAALREGTAPSRTNDVDRNAEWLILQAPPSVFEGDTLVLRCRVKRPEKLGTVRYSRNGEFIATSHEGQDLLIPRASVNNSGSYQCTALLQGNRYTYRSNTRFVKIQELFPHPKLEVTPPQPMEGGSVTLSCQTQLPLERSDTLLSFVFFRERGVMLSNWSRSPELRIAAFWREDSGSFWCEAAAVGPGIHRRSLPLWIRVHGVPVSAVLLETQPQGGHVLAGERLVLVCSVAEGTGATTFSWHREDTGESLGSKRQRSRRAELEIPAAAGAQAGRYYCTADNGHGLARSRALNVTVTGTPGSRSGLIAVGAAGGLLSFLLLALALWICPRPRRISGRGFLGNTARNPPATGPGEAPRARCPAPVQLLWSYDNVHARHGDLVYSEIQLTQPGQEGTACASGTSPENKHASVVYSAVKTQLPEDSAGEVRSRDEDAMESYENVPIRMIRPCSKAPSSVPSLGSLE